MQDNDLHEQRLGVKAPWKVSAVALRVEESNVTLALRHDQSGQFACPEGKRRVSVYDHRHRQWQHRDTCGLVTMIEAQVPRVPVPRARGSAGARTVG